MIVVEEGVLSSLSHDEAILGRGARSAAPIRRPAKR